jgi:hypothetical protein
MSFPQYKPAIFPQYIVVAGACDNNMCTFLNPYFSHSYGQKTAKFNPKIKGIAAKISPRALFFLK